MDLYLDGRSTPIPEDMYCGMPCGYGIKENAYAAADEKATMERAIDGLRGYIECLPGAKEVGIIYGAGAWQLGDILKQPAMQEAYQMGKSVC